MNYKKIIKSQKLRLKLLKITEFIPDKLMIKLQYKIATGNKLNLKEPKRFTEKLQWYKLYYRKPLLTQCADKYEVREYIKEKGLEDILVPLYGVYNSSKDIKFENLPNKFVLKTSNGSHTNILCEDKSKIDISNVREVLDEWLNKRPVKAGREWAYYNIKPRIICEKYLEKDENNDLIDYKFYCFNGKVYCLEVIAERYFEDGMKIGIYDLEFNRLPYKDSDGGELRYDIEKPNNFEKMIEIAEKLSEDFPQVRVDLYNIEGKIVFGELTFYDGSGYSKYIPDEFDFILGKQFKLPNK